MLVDTDVLIWHLRGYPQATRRLDALPQLTGNVKHFSPIPGLRIEPFLI